MVKMSQTIYIFLGGVLFTVGALGTTAQTWPISFGFIIIGGLSTFQGRRIK